MLLRGEAFQLIVGVMWHLLKRVGHCGPVPWPDSIFFFVLFFLCRSEAYAKQGKTDSGTKNKNE